MTQKDWYSPGEIRFTTRQVLWLIQNLGSLQIGHYPPEASNYIDTGGSKGTRHQAPFETAAGYYIEITERLERCGQDGLILEALESWGKSDESMAKYLKIPVWSIRKRMKSALGYMASGPVRRWLNSPKRATESYQDFKQRKHKPSNRNLKKDLRRYL